jgi:hypothetical protein
VNPCTPLAAAGGVSKPDSAIDMRGAAEYDNPMLHFCLRAIPGVVGIAIATLLTLGANHARNSQLPYVFDSSGRVLPSVFHGPHAPNVAIAEVRKMTARREDQLANANACRRDPLLNVGAWLRVPVVEALGCACVQDHTCCCVGHGYTVTYQTECGDCQGVGVYNDGGDYENGIIASSYGCATGGTCCGWKTCTTQAVCGDLASVAYR